MPNNPFKSPEPDNIVRTLSISIAAEKCPSKIPHSTHSSAIARPRDLPNLTGLSKTTIWRLENAGDFPKKIRLSAGAVGYRISEIQAWLDNRQTIGGLQ